MKLDKGYKGTFHTFCGDDCVDPVMHICHQTFAKCITQVALKELFNTIINNLVHTLLLFEF